MLPWIEFYKQESCGKCTPCREGTWWLLQTLTNLENGGGREEDLDILLDQCENILGKVPVRARAISQPARSRAR